MSHLVLKATTFLLLSLFLSQPIITSKAQAQAQAQAQPILDTDGDSIRPDGEYYLVPPIWSGGGGLNYAQTQDYYSRCPSFLVTQSPDNHCGTDYGLPLSLKPINSEQGNIITLSSDVTIEFYASPPRVPRNCDRATMSWKMKSYGDESSYAAGAELGMVVWGGGLGTDDNNDNESSAFKIVKDVYGYKFRYCPTTTTTTGIKQSVCGNLAPVYDRRLGIRRLVVVDDDHDAPSFQIMFVKARGPRKESNLKSIIPHIGQDILGTKRI